MTMTVDLDSMSDPEYEDLVPVFVYGTLRYKQGNYGWCSDAVRYILLDCTIEGQIYFVFDRSGYPVAKLDESGTIIGDILWFDPQDPLYVRVVAMEEGAGYVLRSVEAQCPDGNVRKVNSFHYVPVPRGELIESGDWVAAYRA